MISLKVNLDKTPPALTRSLAGALKQGKVLVLPTDTIPGLSCAADDYRAVSQVYRLKKRDPKKPILILVSDFKMLKKYVRVTEQQARELKKIWLKNRRPTTVILEDKGKLPKFLVSSSRGVAVRLPKSVFLIKILKTLQRPLVSTSVNSSGQRSLLSFKKINLWYKGKKLQPDIILDAGYQRRRLESRLIDFRNPSQPLIMRK